MKNNQIMLRLFEETCRLYSSSLQRYIYTLTRKDQYAMEEIFQNTMVQALSGLKKLRENDKMKAWLFTIAKYEARRYYSKSQKIIYVEFNETTENESNWMNQSQFEDFTKAIEDKEVLKNLLDQIPPEDQQIYILHYFYDLSLKEISETLNINYSTVRSVHVRGLTKLKNKWMEGGVDNERK